ncbi:hypothetical protein KDI_22650 [Dictyobacter arantiisoli]|uniref:Uncharacterized protein n=2 Tax=Dictyobacter arantiisoli TaxID=2014874 RepID=A0A5A5TB40_9CHLR|nr:hypothetical protein KDI_22650 [Dictyobacter arantiisoli]
MLARSADLEPADQQQIERLLGYRIPKGMNEYEIERHPIALRYYYQNPESCLLIHSQSCGNDNYGRPGNFFAHSLAMPPDLFTSIPPIFFWRSPFWCTSFSSKHAELPALSEMEIDPSFEIEQVWELLQKESARQILAALMSTVIHMEERVRPIIIIDSADNVALWIAALSCLLPPAYRPLLSFTTYHHDPRQSPFTITGCVAEAQFQPDASDYHSYFILNATSGKMSQGEDTAYTRLLKKIASEELYEEILLPFFEAHYDQCAAHARIDSELDQLAATWISA